MLRPKLPKNSAELASNLMEDQQTNTIFTMTIDLGGHLILLKFKYEPFNIVMIGETLASYKFVRSLKN